MTNKRPFVHETATTAAGARGHTITEKGMGRVLLGLKVHKTIGIEGAHTPVFDRKELGYLK